MRQMVPRPAPRMMFICCSVRTGSSVQGKSHMTFEMTYTQNTCIVGGGGGRRDEKGKQERVWHEEEEAEKR